MTKPNQYRKASRNGRCTAGVTGMSSAIETLELLLRKTEENGESIAFIYPNETKDFIRGYAAGQTDAFKLALDHIKDIEETKKNEA